MKQLRIFLAIPYSANPETPNLLWKANLYDSVASLGHDVILFEVDPVFHRGGRAAAEESARRRPGFEERLLEAVRRENAVRKIDLFVSYFYESCISVPAVEEIKSLGVPTVNFSCNNVHQFFTVETIAAAFDWCMVPEKEALVKFTAVGARPLHIRMAANPAIYRPADAPQAPQYEATFVGQPYVDRRELIDRLLKGGVEVRVAGPGWQTEPDPLPLATRLRRGLGRWKRALLHRPEPKFPPKLPERAYLGVLSDNAMVALYSQGEIALGFAKVDDPDRPGQYLRHVRLRDFEAPMAGAFYLTEHVPELVECYDIDRELVCFDGPDDLLERAKRWLGDAKGRRKVAEAGRRRALAEHTYQHRWLELFSAIGLS